MSKNTKAIALGMLLVGIFAGAAAAQFTERALRSRFLNTGLFSVALGERANFHVSLDDRSTAQPATVVLQLLDQSGAVVARDQVALAPGQSTTLQVVGPGLYRAHAQVLDPVSSLTARRAVVGTVELIDDLKAVQKFVCSVNEGIGSGRLPD
jgi:hypothetical protein